jgi:hypothetical protein
MSGVVVDWRSWRYGGSMSVVSIAEAWPSPGKPELIAFELRHGRYEEAARVSGDEPFTARRPFDAEVVPARLVAGLEPPPA